MQVKVSPGRVKVEQARRRPGGGAPWRSVARRAVPGRDGLAAPRRGAHRRRPAPHPLRPRDRRRRSPRGCSDSTPYPGTVGGDGPIPSVAIPAVPPVDPESWTDDEWIAWLEATDDPRERRSTHGAASMGTTGAVQRTRCRHAGSARSDLRPEDKIEIVVDAPAVTRPATKSPRSSSTPNTPRPSSGTASRRPATGRRRLAPPRRQREGAHALGYVANESSVVEDLGERTHHQRDVAFVAKQLGARCGHVGGEPLAVREGHHAVLGALPDGDRTGDRGEVVAPAGS